MWLMQLGPIRKAMLHTHVPLLPIGLIAAWAGLMSLKFAEKSAARGGGLMGGIGLIPLAFGAGTSMLAICSIAFALLATPRQANDG